MNKGAVLIYSVMLLLAAARSSAQQEHKDYFGIGSELRLTNKKYVLVFSTHPTDVYYKQTYFLKGEDENNVTSRIVVDVLAAPASAKEYVTSQMQRLERMKATDPFVDYEYAQINGSTYTLSYTLHSLGGGGRAETREWNHFIYKATKDELGKDILLITGISKIFYQQTSEQVKEQITAGLQGWIDELTQLKVPTIRL